jgi:hypothetical protein
VKRCIACAGRGRLPHLRPCGYCEGTGETPDYLYDSRSFWQVIDRQVIADLCRSSPGHEIIPDVETWNEWMRMMWTEGLPRECAK